MGGKAANLFFVGFKTAPFGREVREAVSAERASLEEGPSRGG